jgi:hypothetical protein
MSLFGKSKFEMAAGGYSSLMLCIFRLKQYEESGQLVER